MERIHSNVVQVQERRRICDEEEVLRRRVELLGGKDRVLMKMYLENGSSFRQLARLSGVSPSTVGRRVRRIVRRLMRGRYIKCVRNRDRFSEEELDVARDLYMWGLSMKRIAAKRGLTYYAVRKTVKRIEGILQ